MSRRIFVNLPVRDLDRSVGFFGKLAFVFDPYFTNERATCMIVADGISVMLLVEDSFGTFTDRPVADASAATEAIIALSAESREAVDEKVAKAVAAGGSAVRELEDHGSMHGHGFQDPDGHIWELVFMEPGAVPEG
jgi:predicted lactoylglutathione lyase